MEFELTDHAEKRLRQRRIDREWVEQVLEEPEMLEEDVLDPALEHRLALIPQADYKVLRVVCDPAADPLLVITAFFDYEMEGKL